MKSHVHVQPANGLIYGNLTMIFDFWTSQFFHSRNRSTFYNMRNLWRFKKKSNNSWATRHPGNTESIIIPFLCPEVWLWLALHQYIGRCVGLAHACALAAASTCSTSLPHFQVSVSHVISYDRSALSPAERFNSIALCLPWCTCLTCTSNSGFLGGRDSVF